MDKGRKILSRSFHKYGGGIEMRYLDRDYRQHDEVITWAQYDRFVALANSGRYRVEILDSDYVVSWELRR